jgi:hypothetical protein
MRLIVTTGLFALGTTAGVAQESDRLTEAVSANTHRIAYTSEGVSGPGGDLLNTRAEAAGLVGFGEQHATGDIARFANAWFADLDEFGFDHAILEVGPWSTQAAEALFLEGPNAFEIDASSRAGGMAFPFLFFQEEADLARDIVDRYEAEGPALWGVDQEFIAGGTILADRLGELASTEAQHAAVTDYRAGLAENPWMLGLADRSAFDDLSSAFTEGEGHAIVEEMIRSNRIYAPFTGRGGSGYTANLEREQGMKHYFLHAWDEIEARNGDNPRVFLKFGGYHLMRGHSGTNVPSLGNFIAEWSIPEGTSFYNIMVDCVGGEMTDPRSGETSHCDSYFDTTDTPFEGLAANGPVVINLEALRPLASASPDMDADLHQLIFAFDAYVMLPDVAAANVIEAP